MMLIEDAKKFVNDQIALIEMRNKGKELRPWERGVSLDALLHWGFVQKRLALNCGDLSAACLEGMNVQRERTEAQLAAAAQNGIRLAAARQARQSTQPIA